VHLDTDLGGDTDDACALAMLLGWPGAEIVGITTTIDPGGERAACVWHCLELAGRDDIPVAAGAEVSMTTGQVAGLPPGYWPDTRQPRPSPPGAAIELLLRSIDLGATIVGIGPYTNLAQLEQSVPGSLSRVPVVLMGGWVRPPADGLPAWGPEMDWNMQWDTRAAELVASAATELTLVTLPATLKAHLRAADLPRLRASGPLGELLARQSEAWAQDNEMSELAQTHDGLPDDLLNFHYDPVTCAGALGWSGVVTEEMPLRPAHAVLDRDGDGFSEVWLSAVEAAQRPGAP
jgi:purine nucleosidase